MASARNGTVHWSSESRKVTSRRHLRLVVHCDDQEIGDTLLIQHRPHALGQKPGFPLEVGVAVAIHGLAGMRGIVDISGSFSKG